MINLNEARIDGVELAYNRKFGDTGLGLAATKETPSDAKTGQNLMRRARHFSNVGIVQQLGSSKTGGRVAT